VYGGIINGVRVLLISRVVFEYFEIGLGPVVQSIISSGPRNLLQLNIPSDPSNPGELAHGDSTGSVRPFGSSCRLGLESQLYRDDPLHRSQALGNEDLQLET